MAHFALVRPLGELHFCYKVRLNPRSTTPLSLLAPMQSVEVGIKSLLARVNALIREHTKRIQELRKQLTKADSRATADAIEREIETNAANLDTLKVQQKALKRGIIPEELIGGAA